MQNYNNAIDLYCDATPLPIDNQIIYLCRQNRDAQVPVAILLAEFKFCRVNGVKDSNYTIIRDALGKRLGLSTVLKLEVL